MRKYMFSLFALLAGVLFISESPHSSTASTKFDIPKPVQKVNVSAVYEEDDDIKLIMDAIHKNNIEITINKDSILQNKMYIKSLADN